MITGPEELETEWSSVTGRVAVPAAVAVATGADGTTVSVTVTVTGAHAPAGPEGAGPPAAGLEAATTVMYLVVVFVDVRVVVELPSSPCAVLVNTPGPVGAPDAPPPGKVA